MLSALHFALLAAEVPLLTAEVPSNVQRNDGLCEACLVSQPHTAKSSREKEKNYAGSEIPLPTMIKEKEPLWYWVL
jgi:hypothetical protein